LSRAIGSRKKPKQQRPENDGVRITSKGQRQEKEKIVEKSGSKKGEVYRGSCLTRGPKGVSKVGERREKDPRGGESVCERRGNEGSKKKLRRKKGVMERGHLDRNAMFVSKLEMTLKRKPVVGVRGGNENT